MAKNKTTHTTVPVTYFLNCLDSKQKHADSLRLIELMQQVTNEKAKMWGSSIIGFGTYHYQYASGHSGEAPILGFSPRKTAISLYVYTGCSGQELLVQSLGKLTMGKTCIYIKKLTDVDETVLSKLMQSTLSFLSNTYKRVEFTSL